MKTYVGLAVIAIAAGIAAFWVAKHMRRREPLRFTDDLGASYILKTKDTKKGFEAYEKIREKQSSKGMIITRTFPDKIRQKYKMDKDIFLWLSREKTEGSIDPSDLEKLEYFVQEFVSQNEKAVILLDGIEYIALQNSFESTLKFLQSLNDRIILSRATLIIPLNPAVLDKKQLSLLERELEILQVDYRLNRFFE
ncbi:MAG: DUF835 domain-containing protein [Theionarchaea archaeon]|nr:DUF835 domain-containing protein [Theionarchaea archaeon]MBU7036999.1 DUF835 domain-containing protein [Theionarchaea archaeon]